MYNPKKGHSRRRLWRPWTANAESDVLGGSELNEAQIGMIVLPICDVEKNNK